MAIFLSSISITASRSSPFVRLAQFRIMSPLPLVYALYGRVDPVRTLEEDGVDLFGTESESDRLVIGPVTLANGETEFAIRRVGEAAEDE